MKIKYPIEAFVLAMVVFSGNMQGALLTGILIILITTLGMVIKNFTKEYLPKWSFNVSISIFTVAITYSSFHIVMNGMFNMNLAKPIVVLHVFLGALIAKHIVTRDVEDYNVYMLENAVAFGTLIVIGILREFLSYGSIYGYQFAEFKFIIENFQYITFGLLFAGMALAFLNKVLDHECKGIDSLCIAIPILLVHEPFVIGSINILLSTVISTAIAVVCLKSVIYHLRFSVMGIKWRNLPTDLISLSFIYMILIAF